MPWWTQEKWSCPPGGCSLPGNLLEIIREGILKEELLPGAVSGNGWERTGKESPTLSFQGGHPGRTKGSSHVLNYKGGEELSPRHSWLDDGEGCDRMALTMEGQRVPPHVDFKHLHSLSPVLSCDTKEPVIVVSKEMNLRDQLSWWLSHIFNHCNPSSSEILDEIAMCTSNKGGCIHFLSLL